MNEKQQVFSENTPKWVPKVNREYKSRMFTKYFQDKSRLLVLYNCMSGKQYEDPEQLEINTLENAIYMSMRNDVSFIVAGEMAMYEHQSTYNPNITLRFLFYVADLYSGYVKEMNIYGSSLLYIPTPRFIVFYNGAEERPEYEELRLSDMFIQKESKTNLELVVDVYNINQGKNQELLDSCKPLNEYSIYTSRVRKYAEERDTENRKMRTIEEAVDRAITECIEEGICKEFLEQNRAEAKHMSIYEYNEEKHMKMEREEHFEKGLMQGLERGRAEGRLETLRSIIRDLGEVTPEIEDRMQSLSNAEIKEWIKLAAKAATIREFLDKIDGQ